MAKPEVDTIKALADVPGVSVDVLPEGETAEKSIVRIVITGGPCAGKTTAMSRIQNAFSKMG